MTVNMHRVLKSDNNGYLTALTLDKTREDELRDVRDTVRESLREGFKDGSTYVQKQELFEYTADSAETVTLKPKFRMQGSFSYRTCNKPAHIPPQEIDLDDGMFLPVSFLSQNNTIHPSISSKALFKTVETILEPLCTDKGWTLITKPSCVRVQVSEDAHLDIALYAIPDKEFVTLQEAELSKVTATFDRMEYLNALSLGDDLYKRIRADHIMLAHREEGWKPSDPRKLEDWFRSKLDDHGEQLRRVCRYLKGWRDYNWPETKLSSIALMSAVVSSYDSAPQAFESGRDDRALRLVAESLPGILAGKIENPVVKGQYLDEGWSLEKRSEFINKARTLRQNMNNALAAKEPQHALDNLIIAFGERIPDDQSLIAMEGIPVETKVASSAAASVMSFGILKKLGEDPSVRNAVQKEGDRRYG